jgi:hypothetical protein
MIMTKTQAVTMLSNKSTAYYLPVELPSEVTWQTSIPSGIVEQVGEKKRLNAAGAVITRIWIRINDNTIPIAEVYETEDLAIAALKAAYEDQATTYETAATDSSALADNVDNIGNIAPVAENLVISPVSPTTGDDLIGSYDYSDADGNPESGTIIRWYKDSVVQADYNDLLTVPSSATSQGEQWGFRVRPSDGIRDGVTVTSEPVTIG